MQHTSKTHSPDMLQVDLLDMLYQKSLRLGVDVRNARGIGTVVNLQSNDASKVWMMPVHIHTLWNSPFQVSARMLCAFGDFALVICPRFCTFAPVICLYWSSSHSCMLSLGTSLQCELRACALNMNVAVGLFCTPVALWQHGQLVKLAYTAACCLWAHLPLSLCARSAMCACALP